MHALTILQRCIGPLLAGVHGARLAVLLEAVAATESGPRLTLTDIARRFAGGTDLRHRIKRADRLLGNRHLQSEARGIYGAVARMLLTGVAEPLIVIDWSDLKRDQSLHLLRASVPVGGRSLTLYEEVHAQRELGNRQVQHRFLQRLAQLLPATSAPIIVADAGFKVPFYREVERLGWRWVGRVSARTRSRLHQAQAALAQLQTAVRTGDADAERARHRRVGAQQPAAGLLRAGAPSPAGALRQDGRGQARARRRAGNPPAMRASRGCWWPRRDSPIGRRSGWCESTASGCKLSSASGT